MVYSNKQKCSTKFASSSWRLPLDYNVNLYDNKIKLDQKDHARNRLINRKLSQEILNLDDWD